MKSPFVVIPTLGLAALVLHGMASLLSAIPDVSIGGSSAAPAVSEANEGAEANESVEAPTTTAPVFEIPVMDDSDLSPRASADDYLTLEENDYLPDSRGQYLVLKPISEITQMFPEGTTIDGEVAP